MRIKFKTVHTMNECIFDASSSISSLDVTRLINFHLLEMFLKLTCISLSDGPESNLMLLNPSQLLSRFGQLPTVVGRLFIPSCPDVIDAPLDIALSN